MHLSVLTINHIKEVEEIFVGGTMAYVMMNIITTSKAGK